MAVEAFSQHSKNETETLDSQRHLSISTDNCKEIMSFYILQQAKTIPQKLPLSSTSNKICSTWICRKIHRIIDL